MTLSPATLRGGINAPLLQVTTSVEGRFIYSDILFDIFEKRTLLSMWPASLSCANRADCGVGLIKFVRFNARHARLTANQACGTCNPSSSHWHVKARQGRICPLLLPLLHPPIGSVSVQLRFGREVIHWNRPVSQWAIGITTTRIALMGFISVRGAGQFLKPLRNRFGSVSV